MNFLPKCNTLVLGRINPFNFKYFGHANRSLSYATNLGIEESFRLLRLKRDREILPSKKALRKAYFTRVKLCHPDVFSHRKDKSDGLSSSSDAASLFLRVTEAYEFLLCHLQEQSYDDDYDISESEETEYRQACYDWLGLTAEIVEESKRCPLFRQWLQGNTDSSQKWNMFLCLNGGLVPRLSKYHKQQEQQIRLLTASSSPVNSDSNNFSDSESSASEEQKKLNDNEKAEKTVKRRKRKPSQY